MLLVIIYTGSGFVPKTIAVCARCDDPPDFQAIGPPPIPPWITLDLKCDQQDYATASRKKDATESFLLTSANSTLIAVMSILASLLVIIMVASLIVLLWYKKKLLVRKKKSRYKNEWIQILPECLGTPNDYVQSHDMCNIKLRSSRNNVLSDEVIFSKNDLPENHPPLLKSNFEKRYIIRTPKSIRSESVTSSEKCKFESLYDAAASSGYLDHSFSDSIHIYSQIEPIKHKSFDESDQNFPILSSLQNPFIHVRN